MSVAFLFPGQGSEVALVGRDLAPAVAPVRKFMDVAVTQLGISWDALWAKGARALEHTAVLQPVLTAVALGVVEALEEGGCAPACVAGHSLGELAAWSAAGGISAAEALRLAGERGRLMNRAAKRTDGGMLAIRVRSREALEEALDRGRTRGNVDLAACNAPDEWVVSGDTEALKALAASYPATHLPVSGAWHGSTMAGCVEDWKAALDSVAPLPLTATFLSNQTGQAVREFRDVPRLLADALTHPVQWTRTMRTLGESGITDVVTVGPGKTLRSLARKNGLGNLRFHATDRPSELEKTLELLGS